MVFDLTRFTLKVPGMRSLFKSLFSYKNPKLERELFGLKFKNPVGLAAGLDKNAVLIHELEYLGFGFVEIGTVTPLPQAGNDKPRLFRLPQDEAVINRMGFNNDGMDAIVERLKKRPKGLIVGGNIGKNKVTSEENAVDDYVKCFNALHDYVDYFVVNVSSPNTPGLRALQGKEPLMKILQALKDINVTKSKPKPILLKIAPDLEDYELDDIVDVVFASKIDGIVATNTTVSRDSLTTDQTVLDQIGKLGGVSGKPVKDRSTEVIRYLSQKSNKQIPIIGVGGIFTAQDAKEKLEAGASLVQVYTGFIYEGPSIAKNICKGIV